MRIDVYCDESHPDIFSSDHSPYRYLGIGSVWTNEKDELKKHIHQLRHKHRIGGEFKWNKVSNSKLNFYFELIDWFFKTKTIRFRGIIVDKTKIDLKKYHDNDAELGFYKMYYQMLNCSIVASHDYHIFVDYKPNRIQQRVAVLGEYLSRANFADSLSVQAIASHESVFIQLADVLTGAVTAKFNKSVTTTSAKEKVISHIAQYEKIEAKPLSEQKFNIFCICPGKKGTW